MSYAKAVAVLAALSMGLAAAAPGARAQSRMDVLRGAAAETVAFESGAIESDNRVPQVIRGRVVATPRAAKRTTRTLHVAGGGNLWIYDPARGRVVGCWLRGTGRVGNATTIRCTGRVFD